MIRRATAEDAPALEELHRAAFFGAMPWMPDLHTREEGLAYFARLVVEDEVLVAELDGRVVGYAALGPELLDHLYVHPDAQGCGVGSALLAEAKARRPDGFSLWTFQRNQRARRFYEARGFHALRETDGSGNEERQPDVLYRWP